MSNNIHALRAVNDVRTGNSNVKSDSRLPHIAVRFSFGDVARQVLGADAGKKLHRLTDYPERSCYRYASGESEPPFHFFRLLLNSERGEAFFDAFMEGNTAHWWSEKF
jgi:hypothetical protein